MTVLKGVQYRTPTVNTGMTTPYNGSSMFELISGGGWSDVPEGKNEFTAHTEFRMKPIIAYRLHGNRDFKAFYTKNALLEAVSARIDAGDTVQVSQVEQTITKTDPLLQVYNNGKWTGVSIGATPLKFTYAPKFRLRPDFYYTVTTISSSVVSASIDFEEADELVEYISNRVRTNGLDFSVRKVSYV